MEYRNKVLITGVAGFLGYNLAKRLLTSGSYVLGIDNFYTGQKANVERLSDDKNFTFLEYDIRNKLPSNLGNFDEVYNLACPASPPHYQRDPIFTLETSVLGVQNVIEKCLHDNAVLLHASTSEVYGDPVQHPQCESYWGNVNPIGLRACYDEGKRVAETLIVDYARTRNLRAKFVRIFNTYGPFMRADDGRVVSNFIVQALKGDDITIYGDGEQTRSFCFVDDLIDAMLIVMNKGQLATPYNIGNPTEFTMRELASLVLNLTNSKSFCKSLPIPSDDPKQRKPDISRINSETGWAPKISLEIGLRKTINYFSEIESGIKR